MKQKVEFHVTASFKYVFSEYTFIWFCLIYVDDWIII